MATVGRSKKLHILLMPFFITSHIGPYTDLTVRLAVTRPGVVEPAVGSRHLCERPGGLVAPRAARFRGVRPGRDRDVLIPTCGRPRSGR
jgi:hypothetical protein